MDYSELMHERLETSLAIDRLKAVPFTNLNDLERTKKHRNKLRDELRLIDEELRTKFPEHQINI